MIHWSVAPFESLYEAIQKGEIDTQSTLVADLHEDLVQLLAHPAKSQQSRNQLEKAKLTIDGTEFELNAEFVQSASKLADELDLDEIAAAETLYFALQRSGHLGMSAVDVGKASYHNRRFFILQICSYYACLTGEESLRTRVLTDAKFRPFDSFKQIAQELGLIRQQVERARLLGTYTDIDFSKSVNYCRSALFKELQLLGELFWGYVRVEKAGKPVFTLASFSEMLTHVDSFQTNDMFALIYIPGFLNHLSNLSRWSESDVASLHAAFMKDIQDTVKLSESPFKALLIAVFLTYFIPWCKGSPSRSSKFEFSSSVNEPLQKVISIGAFEQLLSIAADTSLVDSSADARIVPFYDFRLLLQQHIPKMVPVRLLDVDEAATNDVKRSKGDSLAHTVYLDSNQFDLSSHFVDFIAPVLSTFVTAFISHVAFMLTHLRDMEEDLLLSSEELNLDSMAEDADLERFYLSLFYIYAERPALGAEYWADKESSLYTFLRWASKCNSPLISATFCLLLAALSSGQENASQASNFLQLSNDQATEHSDSPVIMGKFSTVSWSTIYSCIAHYNKVLSTPVQSGDIAPNSVALTSQPVKASLGEDSIIFISGFFQLLSEVTRNSPRDRSVVLQSDDYQLLKILGDFLNNETPLSGCALTVLSSLVSNSVEDRKRIWNLVDNWFFRKQMESHIINKKPYDVIKDKLQSYSFVLGFVYLILELLRPTSTNEFEPLEPYFPLDLGSRLRNPGIWVYLDVISSSVFVDTVKSNLDESKKSSLQLAIVELWNRCLTQLDPYLVLNATAAHLKDLDNVVSNHSIIQYLQASQGSAIMCYLYRPQIHTILFQLTGLGIDAINELPENSKKITVVERSLKVVNMLLEREIFFSDELLPILRLNDNKFCTLQDVSSCGMRSFYDALLLQLPLVAHLSLYVSSTKVVLVKASLQLLKNIASSPVFNTEEPGSNLLSHNRLLTMYETVDESMRIRFAFVALFEAPLSDVESFALKVDMLALLIGNLTDSDPSISHFLLGFDTRRLTLGSEDEDGTVLSERSLLKSMLAILIDTAKLVGSATNMGYAPVRLCAMIMELITKLCGSSLFGLQTLDYMRDRHVVLSLLKSANKVYQDTQWAGKTFSDEFRIDNQFVSQGESTVALIAFASYRSLLLELLSMELHCVSESGSLSLIEKYTSLLTNSSEYSTGSLKILELLDVLEFQPRNMIEKIDPLFAGFDYRYVFKRISLKSEPLTDETQSAFDLQVVHDLATLYGKESLALGVLHSNEYKENVELFSAEEKQLCRVLTCSISYDNFKFKDLQYLHTWAILVQVLVADGRMSSSTRDNFISEVFQSVIPKIDDYLKSDVSYAEDLVSLCVSMLKQYGSGEKNPANRAFLDFNRLFLVFKTCISGILLPQSTPRLRADFYVLANSYIQQALESKPALMELMIYIRSVDQRLFQTICNDSLLGEGPCRIPALLLLESFVKVTIQLQQANVESNFLLDILYRSNYLLMLVQKLKSTDEILCECLKDAPKARISLESLLYELTSSKTSLYLMIRIAETRSGAQQLVNCDIFKTIADCKFLSLDPDFGIDLTLTECSDGSDGKYARIKMSLETTDSPDNERSTLSYYDYFVPIFQLVNAIVISLGPQNESSVQQARNLEKHFSKLITAVLKREIILEDRQEKSKQRQAILGEQPSGQDRTQLRELASLFMLLDSLV